MKIISITMAYNEADILDLFVRHHSRFVDHMIIILHGESVDATHEVARQLFSEGLPLTVLRSDLEGHQQSRIVSETLFNAAVQHQPDLALLLDCDEFLCADAGEHVRTILEALPEETLTLVPWRTFVPKAESQLWPDAMTHRRSHEQPQFYKVIIPKKLFSPSLVISQGSHGVTVGTSELSGSIHSDFYLAHVPIRSSEQARRKGLLSWPRQRDNPFHVRGQGYQWETLHERARLQNSFSHEDCIEIAATYACTRLDVCPTLLADPFRQYVRP